ncbi:hypothetical protein BDV35DRAFT_292714 [Aspergillus flavus]|uniref:Uncharacterized protein n=1 Tax=Aspergillus flavus TaxID=5059 RepID=A0A5N6GTR6_ASPFL|nr:hypothetical protein BDV35DRAFT_292714 [Aspergillus flavus]
MPWLPTYISSIQSPSNNGVLSEFPSTSPTVRTPRRRKTPRPSQALQSVYPPPSLPCPQDCLSLFVAHNTKYPNATVVNVPRTETTAVKNVKVLTLHPNGIARSSHRSLDPKGQIFEEPRGAKMGKRAGLGTQVEVC